MVFIFPEQKILKDCSRTYCDWSHVKPAEELGPCVLNLGSPFEVATLPPSAGAPRPGSTGSLIRPPPDTQEWSRIDDLLEWDVVAVAGASGGNIEGGGLGGLGFGTLLQVSLPSLLMLRNRCRRQPLVGVGMECRETI